MNHKTMLRSAFAGLAATACFAAFSPALAEIVTLKAELKGSNEVPSNDSKASGLLTLTFDTATKKLTWKGSYKDLSGPATAAHLHGPAEPGKNASVAVPIPSKGPELEGSADLTEAQAADLLAGRYYVNIHSEMHRGGEIRGQVVK